MSNTKYTVADFFCGCGGFSEGFYQAGCEIVFSLDNWKPAKETHDLNHPNCHCELMDILKLKVEDFDDKIPDTDIIVGSPPCVSFSNSNNSGKADKKLGIQLIHQFLKIILYKKTKPNSKLKYWIMENVPNSLKYIKDKYTAKELGLDENLPDLELKTKNVLTASDYGSPQGRQRAIVGDYIIPEITNRDNPIYVSKIFEMLGPPLNNPKEKIKDVLFNFEISKDDLTDHLYDSKIPECLWLKAKQLKEDHGYMGKMSFPDITNRLSRTIMATEAYSSRESMIFESEDKNGYRAPTIREISSLMGFPINYQFMGNHSTKHKQIGNAVCVQLSHALAVAILKNDNIPINKINQRENIKLECEQTKPLFENFVENPKKVYSKYCRHIPYLKINQLRVELDNTKSNLKDKELKKHIDTLNLKWSSSIHKGTGKNAMVDNISNSELKKLLNPKYVKLLILNLKKVFKNRLYCSKLLQIKNCRIENESNHISPDEILIEIRNILDKLITFDDTIETDVLFDKKIEYHPKILYGLFCVNYVTELLVK